MVQSAGLIMYRRKGDRVEVLLVHPGGPYWARKDEGAWSIPKGKIEPGEDPLEAACREFEEETGFKPRGPYHPLKPIRQRSGKIVYAWAFEGDCDPKRIKSSTFEMEWPPRSGQIRKFPEIDRAQFFTIEEAKRKILPAQVPLLEELEQWLSQSLPQESKSPASS